MKIRGGLFRVTRPVVIAEIGINHNGDVDAASKMISLAAQAGADAVKIQTFVPELLYSEYTASLMDHGRDDTRDRGIIDFFAKFVLDEDAHRHLKSVADSHGVEFFS